MGVVIPDTELAALSVDLHQRAKRIAFVGGHFDLLHVGHLRTLEEARAMADILVAGVYDDGVTRLMKGPGRPVRPEDERAALLASLECVDFVTVMSEETAEHTVLLLKPDVYVQGSDSHLAVSGS